MSQDDLTDLEVVLRRLQRQAQEENIRVTQHAQQEMVEEDITLDEVLAAISTATILENYPKHQRGACCLLNGITKNNRYLHVVCTTGQSALIIITVYEPQPPKWLNPTLRRSKQ